MPVINWLPLRSEEAWEKGEVTKVPYYIIVSLLQNCYKVVPLVSDSDLYCICEGGRVSASMVTYTCTRFLCVVCMCVSECVYLCVARSLGHGVLVDPARHNA